MHAGLVRRERQPIQERPQAMLEARDLPRCDISDFLQARINRALEADLIQRAKERQCPPDQVTHCPSPPLPPPPPQNTPPPPSHTWPDAMQFMYYAGSISVNQSAWQSGLVLVSWCISQSLHQSRNASVNWFVVPLLCQLVSLCLSNQCIESV